MPTLYHSGIFYWQIVLIYLYNLLEEKTVLLMNRGRKMFVQDFSFLSHSSWKFIS